MTEIKMYDGIDLCSVCTNQPRMLRKLKKLRALYPQEITLIERNGCTEQWTVPFWWWNARKRNKPQQNSIQNNN